MPMSKMVDGKCNVLSNPYRETRFHTVKNLNYTIDSLDLKRQKLLSVGITLHKTKALSKKTVLFQTPWEIVTSVPQIVLHYWIALCKPRCDLEANKHSYYITVNTKFVRKCRGLDNSSQKGYSTPSAPIKHASTRCTSTGNTRTIMENNWPLAWYYKKPNSQKRHALAKSQARMCSFLVVWTKLDYRYIAFQRPKSNLKAMKHERWLLNSGKHKSVWKCLSSATLHQKVVLELWH